MILKIKSRVLDKVFTFSLPDEGGYIMIHDGSGNPPEILDVYGKHIRCNNEKGFKSHARSWYGRALAKHMLSKKKPVKV